VQKSGGGSVIFGKFCRGQRGREDRSERRRFVPASSARADQSEASVGAVGRSDQLQLDRLECVVEHELRLTQGSAGRITVADCCLLDLERAFDLSAEEVVWRWRSAQQELIGRTRPILPQKNDRNKPYALHAPEIECPGQRQGSHAVHILREDGDHNAS
jgi:hypothetical protein